MKAIDDYLKKSNYPVSLHTTPTQVDADAKPPAITDPGQNWLKPGQTVWPNPRNIPFPGLRTVYKYDSSVCSQYIDMYDGAEPTQSTQWNYKDSPHTPNEQFRLPETEEERRKRLAQEQQFLTLYDNKYGGLKTPPTLPVWPNMDKWPPNQTPEPDNRDGLGDPPLLGDLGGPLPGLDDGPIGPLGEDVILETQTQVFDQRPYMKTLGD